MSWETDFAKLFKERENRQSLNGLLGRITSINPIRISTFDGQVNLDKRQLLATEGFLELFALPESDSKRVQIGDEVLLMPSTDAQRFFIINRVRKVV